MSWAWQLLRQDWFIVLAAIVGFGLGTFPIVHHLVFGLRERRREILSYFQLPSVRLYFEQFYSAEWQRLQGKSDAEIIATFNDVYDGRFGIRTFLFPGSVYVLGLFVLIGIMVFAFSHSSLKWAGATMETRGLYALAGAYLWVILDLISRYRERDLVPSALYGYTFRFLFSVPVAYAVSTLFNDAAAPPIAFALGAFPTDTLMLFLRRQAAQRLGLGNDIGEQKSELGDLQGVNTTLVEKFGEIGISTFLQLGYEDPIQLTMRTNLSFSFITDVVSQAQAFVYGLDLTKTRPYSVRGAFEASEVFDESQSEDQEAKARADEVINQLVSKLERPDKIIRKILHDIHKDPYTRFLREIWK
jgi:hypothetical protein